MRFLLIGRGRMGSLLEKTALSGGDTVVAALGREDLGRLRELGKCADMFLIDSRRLELVGCCADPKNLRATVGLRGPVDYTVVNGVLAVRQGRLTGWDEEKLSREAGAVWAAYLSR